MDQTQSAKIRINGIPFKVQKLTELAYEDILSHMKAIPFGMPIVYINTNRSTQYGDCGYIRPGEKVPLVDGLDFSAYPYEEPATT